MAAMERARTKKSALGSSNNALPGKSQTLTAAQRIEQATMKKTKVVITDVMSWDCDALVRRYDTEGTQLLSRGETCELLRDIGLEHHLGQKVFRTTAQLLFDAYSADSHFLNKPELKQMYYQVFQHYPVLLPRKTKLKIYLNGARGLPPADANGKADPFCTLQVVGKKFSKSQTRHLEKTLDPSWNEELSDKYGYEDGDDLIFEVFDYDRDVHKGAVHEFLARATLKSADFNRIGGYDGRLALMDCCMKGYNPYLFLRVQVSTMPVPPPALRIIVKYARGLPPADPNGKADPFCIVQLMNKPMTRSQTKYVPKTLEPIWEQELGDQYRYEEGDDIFFEVRDFDGRGQDTELLGRVVLPNAEFAKPGGFLGELLLTDTGKGFSATIAVDVKVRALEPEIQALEYEQMKKELAEMEAAAAAPPPP